MLSPQETPQTGRPYMRFGQQKVLTPWHLPRGLVCESNSCRNFKKQFSTHEKSPLCRIATRQEAQGGLSGKSPGTQVFPRGKCKPGSSGQQSQRASPCFSRGGRAKHTQNSAPAIHVEFHGAPSVALCSSTSS